VSEGGKKRKSGSERDRLDMGASRDRGLRGRKRRGRKTSGPCKTTRDDGFQKRKKGAWSRGKST